MPLAAILSPAGPRLTPEETRFFAQADPWGYILMGRSCQTPEQMRALSDELRCLAGRDCPILIDMEGGRVARMKPPLWPLFPSAAELSAPLVRSERRAFEAVFLAYRLIAAELRDVGVNVDCAPVLDVPIAGADPIIGDRAFGRNAAEAAFLGRACLDGLRAGGVAGVIKHIPGHGRAEADSHLALPRVVADRIALAQDFAPFAALNDAPMAMTAHILYTAYDETACATHSPIVISDVIRGQIGFDGLLMSDDLTMEALGRPDTPGLGDHNTDPHAALAWRAERSIAAGCDVVLHCAGLERDAGELLAQMRRVADAVPALSGAAARRALAAEAGYAQGPAPFDRAAGRALLAEILGPTAPA